jgi:hypothetical protein
MACKECGGLCEGEVGFTLQCACFCSTGAFTSVDDAAGGLVASLGGCVDAIRDINTQFGARQYEVMLIWSKWSGGERGVGEEYVFKETKIEPTPKVGDLKSVSKELSAIGLEESGSLKVTEISPRYDEGFLLGRIDGEVPGEDVNFYWEVRSVPREGAPVFRRRFFPKAAPGYDATKFQWTVSLIKADPDRTPEGLPRG